MKFLLLTLATLSILFSLEQEFIVENSNFVSGTDDYVIDYNRLRLNYNAYAGDFSAKVIVDNDTVMSNLNPATLLSTVSNYATDIPFATSDELSTDPYDRIKLYRAFIKYEGRKHSLNLGLQRVAFGVGRIWTPVDMFNPLQSLSLESSERAPVLAGNYNYALSERASITAVVSQQENKNIKEAIRIKGNLFFGDLALVLVEEKSRRLTGYEIEGELFSTGVEMRSEGGTFTDTITNKSYTKFIIGADYTFENSLMLIGEYLYNENDVTYGYIPAYSTYALQADAFSDVIGHRDLHYFATMLSYELSTLWRVSGIIMNNLVDGSFITVPSLSYSLSDESTLMLGGFFADGKSNSEFGPWPNLYYLNYAVTF